MEDYAIQNIRNKLTRMYFWRKLKRIVLGFFLTSFALIAFLFWVWSIFEEA